METVEVLVRIPKKEFEELQSNYAWWGKHGEYIKNGTVLPKGHDRLIEGDKLIEKIKPLISNKAIIEAIDTIITFSPTVIEADEDGDADG